MTGQTLLGFDYGRRRIGVAVGSTLTGSAQALETLDCPAEGLPDWAGIERLIGEWQPDGAVVGRPEHADGSASPVTRGAERFARQLHGRYGLPVHLVDERLSSREALQRSSGARRPRKGAEALDRLAAAVILETWLAGHGHD